MDSRTLAALCMTDLAPLLKAGKFRYIGLAEKMIAASITVAPTDWHRTVALYRIGRELRRFEAPNRPEADALLRAVRAVVRRRLQERFVGDSVLQQTGRYDHLPRYQKLLVSPHFS